ncbi:MAG: prepilin-type N-terminal cleavage/methylation domain-containing protein [Thermodesulfobacteriota bacterium]|nr:prepilin-type N-terminal cleavage/methylation domain-containing protein [Thermodesulfobacteriota bacterium]
MAMLPTGTSINRSGFTLVELLVVVIVLSLVGFISLPLLANRGEGNERRMVRRIAGTVKQLYNEATLTRDEHLLRFDLSRNSMQAFRLRSRPGGVEKEPFGREVILAPLQLKQVDMTGKGTFRTGQVVVRIFPLGWMEPARLFVVKEGGNEMELTFSPLTGSLTIDAETATVR